MGRWPGVGRVGGSRGWVARVGRVWVGHRVGRAGGSRGVWVGHRLIRWIARVSRGGWVGNSLVLL